MTARSTLRVFGPIATLVLGLPLVGCGGGALPAASEPDQAKQVLTAALDAWKRGEPVASLASAKPPVRVLDREWGDGFVLNRYDLKGEPQRMGLNIQQAVALDLKSPKGKTIKKTVFYTVTTGPQPVVARQDIDE